MSVFFRPYEGKKPYLFISYAHRNSEEAVSTVRILHEKKYRVWYDEGIPAGSDWPKNIADHMSGCDRVLFFLSRRALQSQNCFSEIATAVRLNKPVLIVPLENTEPDAGWKEMLKDADRIAVFQTPEERADAIIRSGFPTRRLVRTFSERIPKGTGSVIVSLLFLAASASLLYLQMNGKIAAPKAPEREPAATQTASATQEPAPLPTIQIGEYEKYFAVSFPDKLQEKAIRKALDLSEGEIYRWQLQQIRELYFCGNMILSGTGDVTFDRDGTCRVNGSKTGSGQVKDLGMIQSAVNIESLALIGQPVVDLSPLAGLTLLRELDLSGSEAVSVSALKDLPSLETLHLEFTNIRDLTPLSALPNLKTVTVSREMLPLTWNEDASFSVVLAKGSQP